MDDGKKAVTVVLDEDLERKIVEEAKRKKVGKSTLIRMILAEYFNKQ